MYVDSIESWAESDWDYSGAGFKAELIQMAEKTCVTKTQRATGTLQSVQVLCIFLFVFFFSFYFYHLSLRLCHPVTLLYIHSLSSCDCFMPVIL